MDKQRQTVSRRDFLRVGGGMGLMALVNSPFMWRNLTRAEAFKADEFSFIFMTDSHTDMKCSEANQRRMAEWIAANAEAMNLRYVAHHGDVGDMRGSGSIEAMLKMARKALEPIRQAAVPFSVAIGNHDYDFRYNGRPAQAFNAEDVFGLPFYANQRWFGGTFESEIDEPGLDPGGTVNHYQTREINGRKFLFLTLEFFPREKVLRWADELVRRRLPDHYVVINTHAYLDSYGNLSNTIPNSYTGFVGNEGDEYSNHGREMWDKYFKHWPNLRIISNGHYTKDHRQQYLAQTGEHGNTVHSHFWNYQNWGYKDDQFFEARSDGENQSTMIRIFKLRLAEQRVTIEHFMPPLRIEGEPAVSGEYRLSRADVSTAIV